MKNLYDVFNISYTNNLVAICQAYQKKCSFEPQNIFYYTKVLQILTTSPFKMIYDASLLRIDIRFFTNYDLVVNEEEEYELANIINWIENLRDAVYDTKYKTNNHDYTSNLEIWYNDLETILLELRHYIKSFYLS